VVTGVAEAQLVDREVGQGDDVDEHLVSRIGQHPLAGILLVVIAMTSEISDGLSRRGWERGPHSSLSMTANRA